MSTLERYKIAAKIKGTWIIGIIALCYEFYFYCNTTYYISNVRTLGYTTAEAGFMVTIMGIVAILSMQIWGPLSDRIGRKKTFMIGLVGVMIFPTLIFFVSQHNPSLFTMYVFCGLATIFMGMAPVFYALMADYFPAEINSTCSGIASAVSAIGSYTGPVLGGLLIDYTGQMYYYCIPIVIAAIVCFFACLTLPNKIDLPEELKNKTQDTYNSPSM